MNKDLIIEKLKEIIYALKLSDYSLVDVLESELASLEQVKGEVKSAESILLKHIGKAYNCRSVFHQRYIDAMEEYAS